MALLGTLLKVCWLFSSLPQELRATWSSKVTTFTKGSPFGIMFTDALSTTKAVSANNESDIQRKSRRLVSVCLDCVFIFTFVLCN